MHIELQRSASIQPRADRLQLKEIKIIISRGIEFSLRCIATVSCARQAIKSAAFLHDTTRDVAPDRAGPHMSKENQELSHNHLLVLRGYSGFAFLEFSS